MKICLIDLPGVDPGLNIGLGYLTSSLMKKGHFVKVIDLNNYSKDVEERVQESSKYDMVGISLKSFALKSAQAVSQMIKSKNLICGGPHMTADGYNFLLQNKNFDMAVVGEGEETLTQIAEAIENNRGLQDIKGLIYKDKTGIVVNPARSFTADLDSLPYPNYEAFDSFKGTIVDYPLVTSRGCPYSCIFCFAGLLSGKKWRSRKPLSVIEELEFAKSQYNSRSFTVLDDNFTLDINRAKEICRLLIEHKINMQWQCSNGIRADRLDDELAALMKEAGCISVGLGIESADPEIFPTIKKGESLDDIKRAIGILNKHKIRVNGYFIIGLPGDSLNRVASSIEQVKKMGLSGTAWAHLSPYPKTEVWEWVTRNARIIGNWEEAPHTCHRDKIVFETDDFSQKERIYAYHLANVKCQSWAFLDYEKSFIYNVFNILRLILKYDAKNILSHLFYALRKYKSVWRLYRKTGTQSEFQQPVDSKKSSQVDD